MKIIAAAPCALLILWGCSQHSGTTAARPDTPPPGSTAPSADLNTFGESKDPSADQAARARDDSYSDNASGRQAKAADSGNAPAPR